MNGLICVLLAEIKILRREKAELAKLLDEAVSPYMMGTRYDAEWEENRAAAVRSATENGGTT